jgi:hypothetical protein
MKTKLAIFLLTNERVNADQQGACAGMNAIIAELPQTIPNSYVISSAGCRKLGNRYGEKMLSLLGYKVAEPAQSAEP